MNTKEPLWTWIPNVRLNDLYFEKPYAEFEAFIADKYYVNYSEGFADADEEEEVTYKSDSEEGIFSFTEKTHIFISAEIWSNLYYKGRNLIGLTPKELKAVLDVDDLQKDEEGYYYDSDELNAIFWIENGIVESVSVH
ncbi:hypothetical protein PT286_09865 [Neisseriaceae bacterium ESL0693]|nr:hypothetical protein [Neisseriaceae bacterium ESL0693]